MRSLADGWSAMERERHTGVAKQHQEPVVPDGLLQATRVLRQKGSENHEYQHDRRMMYSAGTYPAYFSSMSTFWVFHQKDSTDEGCGNAVPAVYLISSITVNGFFYHFLKMMVNFEDMSSFDGKAKGAGGLAFMFQITYSVILLTCSKGDERPTFGAMGRCVASGYIVWNFVLGGIILVFWGTARALDPLATEYTISGSDREKWTHGLIAREQSRKIGYHFDNSHQKERHELSDRQSSDEGRALNKFNPATSIEGELDRQAAREKAVSNLIDDIDAAENADTASFVADEEDGGTAANESHKTVGRSLRRIWPLLQVAFRTSSMAKLGILYLLVMVFFWAYPCTRPLLGGYA